MTGAVISRNESYCRTESASMQMKYGYWETLMPMLSASDFPPLPLLTSVSSTPLTLPTHTASARSQGT